MATKLYLSAERVSREDEFEHHLQIARDRNLGIKIQEFYLPELMWGNWKPRLEQYKQLGFVLALENTFEPGPETLVPIFDRLKSVHFKWNLDVGHVNAFAQNNSLAEWIDALHPHLG